MLPKNSNKVWHDWDIQNKACLYGYFVLLYDSKLWKHGGKMMIHW